MLINFAYHAKCTVNVRTLSGGILKYFTSTCIYVSTKTDGPLSEVVLYEDIQ